jgi:hypothetical protein
MKPIAPETRFILICYRYGDQMVQRFITQEALEEYLNDENNIELKDVEVYEVKPYQIKLQVSIVASVSDKETRSEQ